MNRRCRGEQGTVSIFVAVMAVAFLLIAGLAVDGGNKLGALSEARDIADNAARAGAQAVDDASYRASGTPTLDPVAAIQAANRYLASVGHSGSVEVDGASVTVTVTITVPTRFLPGPFTVSATEQAAAVFSIESQ